MTSARCPLCDNWAPILEGGALGRHKSNVETPRTGRFRHYLNCQGAGRTREMLRDQITPNQILVRNALKRNRQLNDVEDAGNTRRFRW